MFQALCLGSCVGAASSLPLTSVTMHPESLIMGSAEVGSTAVQDRRCLLRPWEAESANI